MSIEVLIGLVLTVIGCYAIYREKDLIRFERKVAKYVKAFFKALYYTMKEKMTKE